MESRCHLTRTRTNHQQQVRDNSFPRGPLTEHPHRVALAWPGSPDWSCCRRAPMAPQKINKGIMCTVGATQEDGSTELMGPALMAYVTSATKVEPQTEL